MPVGAHEERALQPSGTRSSAEIALNFARQICPKRNKPGLSLALANEDDTATQIDIGDPYSHGFAGP
jgi:hypothetical protein